MYFIRDFITKKRIVNFIFAILSLYYAKSMVLFVNKKIAYLTVGKFWKIE